MRPDPIARSRRLATLGLLPLAALLSCAREPHGFGAELEGEDDAGARPLDGSGAGPAHDAGSTAFPLSDASDADQPVPPPSPGPPPYPDASPPGAADASDDCGPMIDDMEHGAGAILAWCGRRGYWYAYNDGTPTATQAPPAGGSFLPAAIPGGRAGSTEAAHATGSGFTTWGAGIAFDFASAGGTAAKAPYDARAYSAVTFWARSGAAIATATMRVNLASSDTDPSGGVCTPTSKCNDHFGATVTLTASWSKVTLAFASARQLGWGSPVPALRPDRLLAMQFQLPAGQPFDVWIDDVAFVP